jgi:hypothetical protein
VTRSPRAAWLLTSGIPADVLGPLDVGWGGLGMPRDYLRFNRAANSPPNPARQGRAGQHEGHTFYRFKPGSECG